jgi:Spy/CpxP family protein refolding chaperone
MNKMIVCLISGVSISLAAYAQSGQSGSDAAALPGAAPPSAEVGKHHGIKLKQLSQELGLSEAQESKIKSLFKKHKQKIKEAREESKDEIKGTLTPAQKLKLYRLKEKNSDKLKALKQAVKEEENKP